MKKSRVSALLLASSLVLGSVLGTLKVAAQPANDLCNNAVALTAGTPHNVNTAAATATGDPTPTCQADFGAGVWYTFTPTTDGPVTISTCGTDFDSVISVYTGACGALVPLAGGCNDDDGPACQGVAASITFTGTAGTTYRILVGGFAGNGGNLVVVANSGDVPPDGLTNDDCSGAIQMVAGTSYNADTTTATTGDDPLPDCQQDFGAGVWYTFTPAANGPVIISTCGSDFDTVLGVFTGSCGALTPLAGGCNDDNGPACEGLQASISFEAVAGTTYWILAGGVGQSGGNLVISANADDSPPPGAPVIATGPQTQTVCIGESPSLNVVATSSEEVTYTWFFNGAELEGETGDTLTFEGVQPESGGDYQVVVANSMGAATSSVARLIVNAPPSISAAPSSVIVTPGSVAEFNVIAAGGAPFTFQWFRDGVAVPNSNLGTLMVNNAQSNVAGVYHVTVSNPCGEVTSDAVTLVVVNRALRIGSTETEPGSVAEVPVRFLGTGEENRIVFTVLYDESLVSISDVVLAADVPPEATVEWFSPSSGELQVDVFMPEGQVFTDGGEGDLVLLQFDVSGDITDPSVVLLTLGNPSDITNTNGESLVFAPGTGNILITGGGIEPPQLNSGTGLFEDDLVVAVPAGGLSSDRALRIYILGLGTDSRGRPLQVYNATSATSGVPYMQINGPIDEGLNIINVQYISLDRTTVPDPDFVVQELPAFAEAPALVGEPISIPLENVVVSDGAVYLKFETLPGRKYYIQFSEDMVNWETSLPPVTGNGGYVIWMDNGPPKTPSRPGDETARFYRAFLAQ